MTATITRDVVDERFARELVNARAQAVAELVRLWPALDVHRLDATYPAWAAAVTRLVETKHMTVANAAAEYLTTFRRLSGVEGEAPLVFADLPLAQLETSLRVTSIVAAKRATAAGMLGTQAMRSALVQSTGAASRLILNGARDTIVNTVKADPRAAGWRRITRVGACGFCTMLAGRGAVYSADTVAFRSHDHCGCRPQPVYDTGA